ncbi:MAG: glycerol-3-phosphate dehydrogenase/oxidase [Bacteroidetes bacterium]|nr:glycerol-3-phosphate dehydrogenase/oxidase [Bacteroidota bacterium]
METLSSFNRDKMISKMKVEEYDLLIIGGGITGAGIALDAASRGLKTALVERDDFASGTSSRSTKLIHGGLRYLKQFEIAMVREVGQERAIVHKLAPHLVTPEKMLLPLIKGGSFGKITTSLGLMIYDVLAGVEKADQRKMLDEKETLAAEPLLPPEIVEGGGIYAEYRTDDARLTIEVIKTAAQYGAHIINYMVAKDFIYRNNMVCGIACKDLISGKELDLKSKFVVSAAGPWVDDLRSKNKSKTKKGLILSKGVHIVVANKRFPVKQSVYFDVLDGRMIFAIPRGKITYIGTTDTFYEGDKDNVQTYKEDATYLLDAVNNIFPSLQLKLEDIESSWAGLRPLIYEEGKSASEVSRKDEIFESPSGLISIAGGKLTGYRIMAEKLVDLVINKFTKAYGGTFINCKTDKIVFTGGKFKDTKEVNTYTKVVLKKIANTGLNNFHADYLVSNYGKQTELILEKMDEITATDPEVKLGKAELWFTVNYEMVFSLLDYFSRRSGRLYFDIQSIAKLKKPLVKDLGKMLDWNNSKTKQELASLDQAVYNAGTVFKN